MTGGKKGWDEVCVTHLETSLVSLTCQMCVRISQKKHLQFFKKINKKTFEFLQRINFMWKRGAGEGELSPTASLSNKAHFEQSLFSLSILTARSSSLSSLDTFSQETSTIVSPDQKLDGNFTIKASDQGS